MSQPISNLVGSRFGPFEVIVDERKRFHDPVTVRAVCCGRVIPNKTVFALNTARWRKGRRCLECLRGDWGAFTADERKILARSRRHGSIKLWSGQDGARRMLDALGPRPSPQHHLGVRNFSKPHGPGNSAWMLDGEMRVARGTAIGARAVDGTVTTRAGAARALGVTREAVRQRQLRGWTLDEATMTPKGQVPERLRLLRGGL